jgi:predicted nucleic acid-binding protein
LILVDSSVWIDYFRGTSGPEADRLDALLGEEALIVGDIVLAEVLQGFRREADFGIALGLFDALPTVEIVGRDVAIEAARNFRRLRARGVTVRKTIDTLIATWCILNETRLLYSDRDFDPFVAHLGLRSAMPEPSL